MFCEYGPWAHVYKNFSEMLLRIALSFDLSVKKLLVKSRRLLGENFLRVGDF